MAYPLKTAGAIAPPPQPPVTFPFRPAQAGLVKVIVTASGLIPPPPPHHSGENDPPPVPVLGLRLELFKPGNTTPALTQSDTKRLKAPPIVRDFVLLWGDVAATADELGADWTVRITNIGNLVTNYQLTVRYQVMTGNLGKVDHVVVLMMENRSFDQMLGYLSLEKGRTDVDGLRVGDHNKDASGNVYPVHPFGATETRFRVDPGHGAPDADEQLSGDTLTKAPDVPAPPGAGAPAVLQSNAGFVRNFAEQIAKEETLSPQHDSAQIVQGGTRRIPFRPLGPGIIAVRSEVNPRPARAESGFLGQLTLRRPGGAPVAPPVRVAIGATFLSLSYTLTAADLATVDDWTCEVANESDDLVTFTTDIINSRGPRDIDETEPVGAIMGYHNDAHLAAYDLLAREYAICDRWFSSVATDTWPNRLYAMSGGSGGSTTTPSPDDVAANPPGYTLKTIFEVLQEHAVDWMIYFSDLPFALIIRKLAQDAAFTARMRSLSDFLQRAQTGDLPSVTWLDPNYGDVPDNDDLASDDHPPYGDVVRGQQLIAQVYNALAQSPAWSKTLLLITYDEHGGFYDHVLPPGTPPRTDGPPDDVPALQRYGLRVPAFVVSSWVARGTVSTATYDHTSLLRTILLRFCATTLVTEPTRAAAPVRIGGPGGPAGPVGPRVPSMGARTDHANDVGALLSADVPRTQVSTVPPIPPPADARRAPFIPTAFGAVLRRALLGF